MKVYVKTSVDPCYHDGHDLMDPHDSMDPHLEPSSTNNNNVNNGSNNADVNNAGSLVDTVENYVEGNYIIALLMMFNSNVIVL